MTRIASNPPQIHILSQNVQGLSPEKENMPLQVMDELHLDGGFIEETIRSLESVLLTQILNFR